MTAKFKLALWTAIAATLGVTYESLTDETTLTVAECTASVEQALAETLACEGHITLNSEWNGDPGDPTKYTRFVRMSKTGDMTLTGPVRDSGYPKWEADEMEPAESEPAPEFKEPAAEEPAK